MWLAAVSGRSLFLAEITSPLTLAVLAVVLLPVLGYYFIAARSGSERALARARLGLAVAVLALVVLVGVNYYTLQPGRTYGLELVDGRVVLHYYEERSASYNLCNLTVRLVGLDEARGMLGVRTYGTSDPTTGLSAGEFKLTDGRNAHVLIAPGAGKALIIEEPGKPTAIVAVPGVEEAYTAILQARGESCG